MKLVIVRGREKNRHPESAKRDEGSQNAKRLRILRSFAALRMTAGFEGYEIG